jgi:hypothetical protein
MATSIRMIKQIHHEITLVDGEIINILTRQVREDSEFYSLFMPLGQSNNIEINRSLVKTIKTTFEHTE